MAGDAAASSYTAKRLTTVREPHLEKRKQRDREREGTETQPHSSHTQIHCSRELLENEELHGPDQITLQNKRLHAFDSCTKEQKNERRETYMI